MSEFKKQGKGKKSVQRIRKGRRTGGKNEKGKEEEGGVDVFLP